MIRSGRTISAKKTLKAMFDQAAENQEAEDWGFDIKSMTRLLQVREVIPFRRFMAVYLLTIHKEQLAPYLPVWEDEKKWMAESVRELMNRMEAEKDRRYEESSPLLQILTDLVFDDFVSNEFCERIDGQEAFRVRGSVNWKKPSKWKKEKEPLYWDKNELLMKLKSDQLAKTEYLNEEQMFAFAFGLNMDWEDISLFLKKVLRRSDFNLWNWKEFLLYMTYRYASGSKFEFYCRLKEAYENEKNTPVKCQWREDESFHTRSISDRTELMMQQIREQEYSIALDEKGRLPKKMTGYIRRYKYLIQNSGDYTRTAASICKELLDQVETYVYGGASEEAKKAKKREHLEYEKKEAEMMAADSFAQGKVTVYYEPELGLVIPKGTVFTKTEKKTKRQIGFQAMDGIFIKPEMEGVKEVQIELECIEKEYKKEQPKDQAGYVPSKTTFSSDSRYLSDMKNKSYFKIPNGRAGEKTRVQGKITAKCQLGRMIPAGTLFYAHVSDEKIVTFRSKKDTEASACAEIWVRGLVPGEEAVKGEITGCTIENWEDKFVKIENTKIGILKKTPEQAVKGGWLYNYLYQISEGDDWLKNKEDQERLCQALEGTKLSSTKISQIRNQAEKHITRNDLLTLSFLAYVCMLEETGEETSFDIQLRYADFMKKTDENLKKCGFYGLYAPNLYDSLLVCLLSGDDPFGAFKSMWSTCLKYQSEKENTGGGK